LPCVRTALCRPDRYSGDDTAGAAAGRTLALTVLGNFRDSSAPVIDNAAVNSSTAA